MQDAGEVADPKVFPVQAKPVHVVRDGRMAERCRLVCAGIVMEKPLVFGANPQLAIGIGAKLTHPFPETVCKSIGIELMETSIRLWEIVHASEIGTYPHASFLIFAKCINGIVRNGIGVALHTRQVGGFVRAQVVDINTRFGAYPQLVVGIEIHVAHKDIVSARACFPQQSPDAFGGQVDFLQSGHRAQVKAIVRAGYDFGRIAPTRLFSLPGDRSQCLQIVV